jgi:DNA-binding NarL/FixJ family response regulator
MREVVIREEKGRYILELQATIRIPIEFQALTNREMMTTKERRVLAGILHGQSNKEIANDMERSRSYVRYVITGLFRKFKVHTRSELQAIFAGEN